MNVDLKLTDADLDALAERLLDRLPKAGSESPWMRLRPAADYLGTTEEALRKAAQRNQIKHYQPSGHRGKLFFAKDDLDTFVTGGNGAA